MAERESKQPSCRTCEEKSAELTTLGAGSAKEVLGFGEPTMYSGTFLVFPGWEVPNSAAPDETGAIVTADKKQQLLGYSHMVMGILTAPDADAFTKLNQLMDNMLPLPLETKNSDELKALAEQVSKADVVEGKRGTKHIGIRRRRSVDTFTPKNGSTVYFDGNARYTRGRFLRFRHTPYQPGATVLLENNISGAKGPDRMLIVKPQK